MLAPFLKSILAVLVLLALAACKNDTSSCKKACNDPYFECIRKAAIFGTSPQGERPEDEFGGGAALLWLGCETDKAVCKSNCNQAVSAQ